MPRVRNELACPAPLARESGVALVAMLMILAFLLALGAALGTSIINDVQLRGAYSRATAGFYAAESGLDVGMGGYRNLFSQFKIPSTADFQPQTLTVGKRTVTYRLADRNSTPGMPTTVQIPFGQAFGGCNAQRYTYTVASSATNSLGDTEANVGAEFQVGYIPLFQFLAFYANDLEIDPGVTMTLNGRLHANRNLYLGPDGNLTISTNAAMGINYVQVTAGGSIERGRKDTAACNSVPALQVSTASNTLQTLGCVGGGTAVIPQTTLSSWGGTMLSNIPQISVPQPSIVARGSGDYWSKADLRIALILNRPWSSTHFPGVYPHSIVVLDGNGNIDTTKQTALENFIFQTPKTDVSAFPNTRPIFYSDVPTTGCANCSNSSPWGCTSVGYAGCYFPNFKAKYAGDGTQTLSADQRVYASAMNSPGKPSNPLTPADTDPRRGGFYNWREGRWTYMLNINIQDLLQWNIKQNAPFFNPSDATDAGVVVYATVYDTNNPSANLSPNASTGFGFGVRVFGSQTLPFPSLGSLGNDPTGITVASDRSIYVLGDYNAPGGAVTPQKGWQPSSLVGDAINVMSNAYFSPNAPAGTCTNDCQSNRDLNDAARTASTTTINAAFLAGVDTTTSGSYNGGLENYPRFHENWTGVTFNYLGSFVSLGTPQSVSGAWCGTGGSYAGTPPSKSGCNIYKAPVRAWNFDPNFQNVAYLPPLTPHFIYVQQIYFTERFE